MDRAFVRAKGGWDKWHDYEMTIAPYENGNHTCPVPWHRHSEFSRGGDRLHAAPGDLNTYAAIAFGCPAMGAEQLEESEFEPMFAGLEGSLNGKKVALFGSYGWGDGQWMRDWCERVKEDGAQLFSDEGLICNETPDDDAQAACRKLGADLANW